MSEPFYIAHAAVRKIRGVHRRAALEVGGEFDMGVHGRVKEHYRIEAEDLPLPVDYIVAAAGG